MLASQSRVGVGVGVGYSWSSIGCLSRSGNVYAVLLPLDFNDLVPVAVTLNLAVFPSVTVLLAG